MLSLATRSLRTPLALPASLLRSYTTSLPSLDSHDDFAPKMKGGDGIDADMKKAMEMIEGHVKANPIMLYMKGSPSAPQCGFSAKVVGILQNHEVSFSSVNVLEYPTVREGVKAYSDWPTIPQLYVNGEFVGGCDIVLGMEEDGELGELLDTVEGAKDSKE